MQDLTPQVNILAEHAHAMHAKQPRSVLAIAGPPGAGKKTLAAELARRLNDQKCPTTLVPLEGFQLDNAILAERGLEGRKGAPESYDVESAMIFLHRLKQQRECVFPVFDATRDLSIAAAAAVPASCAVVIVTGSYLLFDEPPWRELPALWDFSVWLDIPAEDLRARLIHRWLRLNYSRMVATRRVESNDLLNAERIRSAALPADINL